MPFNLALAGITILLCLFFFVALVVFINSNYCCCLSFFTIPIKIENARVKLALTFPTGAPVTVENDAIEMQLMTYEAINDLSN